jgi:hypothetical protein
VGLARYRKAFKALIPDTSIGIFLEDTEYFGGAKRARSQHTRVPSLRWNGDSTRQTQRAFTRCADSVRRIVLLSKTCGLPVKIAMTGSWRPCGLPLPQCVRKVAANPFGLTVYLLPHYDSHSAPWAQQAFTCCADLNDGSALFRRHVAFPSRQFLQVPDSLVVCPYRNVLERVVVNPFGLTPLVLAVPMCSARDDAALPAPGLPIRRSAGHRLFSI